MQIILTRCKIIFLVEPLIAQKGTFNAPGFLYCSVLEWNIIYMYSLWIVFEPKSMCLYVFHVLEKKLSALV